MEQMAAHYLRLLEAVAGNPRQQVAEFDLLSSNELIKVIEEWNETSRDIPDATLTTCLKIRLRRLPKQRRSSLVRAAQLSRA